MALTQSEQARILKEDRARRYLREQAEAEAFAVAKSRSHGRNRDYVNPELVRGIGVISPPRHVSANPTAFEYGSWARGMRGTTRGIAPGTEDTSDGTPTMRVIHADGTANIVPVHTTRTRNTRYTRTAPIMPAPTTPETATLPSIRQGETYN